MAEKWYAFRLQTIWTTDGGEQVENIVRYSGDSEQMTTYLKRVIADAEAEDEIDK